MDGDKGAARARSHEALRALRAQAERANGAALEPAWFEVARFAAANADPDGHGDADAEVARILKDACGRLPASSLAAVAAQGRHPILSVAFSRAIARLDLRGRDAGVTAAAEAAAECRDALARYGPMAAPELLSMWRRYGPAGFGAGGASSSVYHIALVGSGLRDTGSADMAFVKGFRAGVEDAAGPLASRFVLLPRPGTILGAAWRKITVARASAVGAGIYVVMSGRAEADMATGLGYASGVLIVDARPAESPEPEEVDVIPPVESFDPSAFGRRTASVLIGDDSLRYPTYRLVEGDTGLHRRWGRDFVASPMGIERARRLVGWIATATNVESVAVALPEFGGDLALARAAMAMRVGGRDGKRVAFVPLEYVPGRRNYAPEVKRFRELGCDALLLCGPPEEDAEWLIALAAARLKPAIFGGAALDPVGYHDAARRAAEGAVYVGSEWRAIGEFAQRLEAARRGIAREGEAADFDRGFIVGSSIARRVVLGNCTPGLLIDALTNESPYAAGMVRRMLNPGDSSLEPGRPIAEAPLFVIRNGSAERISGR